MVVGNNCSLLLLDHGDQTKLQLEVVGINRLSSDPRVILIDYRPQVVSETTSFILWLLAAPPPLLLLGL